MAANPTLVLHRSARGNLGAKLAEALPWPSYDLRCLDLQWAAASHCVAADLAAYDDSWVGLFDGANTILHFAGEPQPTAPWASVHRANIVATANVLRACRMHRRSAHHLRREHEPIRASWVDIASRRMS